MAPRCRGWGAAGGRGKSVGIPLKSLEPWAPSHPRSYLWVPVPGWSSLWGTSGNPPGGGGQEKKADQRAGALTRESERPSLSISWRGSA